MTFLGAGLCEGVADVAATYLDAAYPGATGNAADMRTVRTVTPRGTCTCAERWAPPVRVRRLAA